MAKKAVKKASKKLVKKVVKKTVKKAIKKAAKKVTPKKASAKKQTAKKAGAAKAPQPDGQPRPMGGVVAFLPFPSIPFRIAVQHRDGAGAVPCRAWPSPHGCCALGEPSRAPVKEERPVEKIQFKGLFCEIGWTRTSIMDLRSKLFTPGA